MTKKPPAGARILRSVRTARAYARGETNEGFVVHAPVGRGVRAARRPAHRPTHPGEVLRDVALPALGLDTAAAAGRMGVDPAELTAVLTETAPITPALADAVGRLCGNGPGLWLRMQQAHDAHHEP